MRLAPVVVAAAMVLTGCSDTVVGSDGPQPGVAAEVDGELLTIDDVDSIIEEYCVLWAEWEDATPIAKSTLRTLLVRSWVHSIGVERLADEAGIPTLERTEAELEAYWADLGEIDEGNREALAAFTRLQDLLGEPLVTLGTEQLAEESDTPPSGEAAQARGLELVTEWLADQDVVVNPAFGSLEDGEVVIGGDSLSVPVSGFATTAAELDPAPEHLNSLPAVQRCGPEATPAPPAQPLPVQ